MHMSNTRVMAPASCLPDARTSPILLKAEFILPVSADTGRYRGETSSC